MGAALFVGGLILLLVLGTYVLQLVIWLAIGAFHLAWVVVQALVVAVYFILRPTEARRLWRQSGQPAG